MSTKAVSSSEELFFVSFLSYSATFTRFEGRNMNPKNSRESKQLALRKEMLEKERNSYTSSVDAAAIQHEIARKFSLPNAPRSMNKPLGSSKKNKILAITDSNNRRASVKISYKTCPSCGCDDIESDNKICTRCGFFFHLQKQGNNTLSLAQKRGLVDVPEELRPLTIDEWNDIEFSMSLRNESACPICMSGFTQQYEVLLSCSHVFHRACIASFEKFSRKQPTPEPFISVSYMSH